MILDDIRNIKPQIIALSDAYGIGDIRVFGSVARGEADENSDIDFLVSLKKPIGFEFAKYVMQLTNLLNRKVDVVTEQALKPSMKQQVYKDAVPLWKEAMLNT
mgnify:CR=1 FL=1